MRQKILNEVALSLSRRIRNKGKTDPQMFQTACQTFVQVFQMMGEEPPPEEALKALKSDINRILAHLQME